MNLVYRLDAVAYLGQAQPAPAYWCFGTPIQRIGALLDICARDWQQSLRATRRRRNLLATHVSTFVPSEEQMAVVANSMSRVFDALDAILVCMHSLGD